MIWLESIGWATPTALLIGLAAWVLLSARDDWRADQGNLGPTDDAECRAECDICFDEAGNDWPCAKDCAKRRVMMKGKSDES